MITAIPALRTQRTRLLACLLVMSWGGAAYADAPPMQAERGGETLQGILSESFTYASNPLLQVSNARTLYGSVTSPELVYNNITPTLALKTDTRLDENLYNLSNFDSTDIHSKASLNDQQQRAMLTPHISYNPMPNDKFSLSGSAQRSQYASSVFSDYDAFSVTPGYEHKFDPLNTGIFSIQAQRFFTTTGLSNRIDTVGPSVGWSTIITPQLSANANVGIQTVHQYTSNIPPQPWTLQYDFSANVTYKGDRDAVDFNTSRNQFPFGNGTEGLLTRFSLADKHTLNESLALNVGASYQFADYQVSSAGNLDTLATGNLGLTYHLTNHFDASTSYQYRHETLTQSANSAQDHAAMLTLTYRTHE
jgi:hypothetical protein